MDQLNEAISLLQSQQFANAETAFNNLLEGGGTDTKIHQYLAESQMHQQKFTEAIDTLEKGLKITPEKTELLVYLSQVLWGTGQKNKAIPPHEKALQLMPSDMQLMSNMAGMYYEMSRKDDAIEIFEKMLRISPDSFQIQFSIGSILLEESRYEEAANKFQLGLNSDPNNSFGNKQMGMALHISGSIRKALEHYETAFQNASNEAEKIETLILKGNALRDLNIIDQSKSLYEEVLELDPANEVAKNNLQTLARSTIPSWHFHMLADISRNEAYDEAISAAVKPGHHVLDIGTGSGLLSMMAAKAGAKEITAVEMDPDLAKIARLVIEDNNYDDRITVYEKRSTALVVGLEMEERADLLVSEILDAALLGEGVLPSLRHAWSNLLKKDAICIPKAADVKAVIIQSDAINMVSPIDKIQGFDLSAFNHFRKENAYFSKQSSMMETENLSDVFSVFSVDFYNLPEQATPDKPNTHSLEIPITKDGRMHGVLFWFDLHVDDNITMSSGPGGELLHWGQALYMFDDEQEVKSGESVCINALQSEMAIKFDKN